MEDTIEISGSPATWSLEASARKLLTAMRKEKLIPHQVTAILSISCVSSARMSELNFEYRGKHQPTDVLSFEQARQAGGPKGILFLGDLVLCAPVVRRQAREQKHGVRDEAAVLLAHGMLHLLGFDHEKSSKAAAAMAKAEARLLKAARLGGQRPGLIARSKVKSRA